MARDFCEFSLRQERNFGIVATSRTESKHGQLKRLISRKRPDYASLGIALERHLKREYSQYLENLQADCVRSEPFWVRNNAIRLLPRRISKHAMGEIWTSTKIAMSVIADNEKAQREDRSPRTYEHECTGAYSRQMGLPCSHKIYSFVGRGQQFIYHQHVSPHWWLQLPNVSFLEFLFSHLCPCIYLHDVCMLTRTTGNTRRSGPSRAGGEQGTGGRPNSSGKQAKIEWASNRNWAHQVA